MERDLTRGPASRSLMSLEYHEATSRPDDPPEAPEPKGPRLRALVS